MKNFEGVNLIAWLKAWDVPQVVKIGYLKNVLSARS